MGGNPQKLEISHYSVEGGAFVIENMREIIAFHSLTDETKKIPPPHSALNLCLAKL